ncbi:MAG: FAD-binding oxidoreductase [Segniliparus sp.]|uniref:FAD-binding oxidoreductase n=1 Tax=Segniliparus sp. TaxID=2804064 RepID=UPI003F35D25A
MADDIAHRLPLPTMRWNAWGVAADQTHLSEGIKGLLAAALGVAGPPSASPAPDSVRLADSLVGEADLAAFAEIVGAEHVSAEPGDRLPRAGGKSTPDLLRRKQEEQDAPDAVVLPGDEGEVAAVLAYCEEAGIAVVPFGGGTSVVGGLDPVRGGSRAVVALDLRRFDKLVALDEVSQLATLQAGLTGPQAEELLGGRGYRLGHYPQSFQFATIGGFAAARSSGQASSGHGRFDEMVVGLTVVAPRGTLVLGRAQKSAAGPDLRQVFLGSEGVFGVITEVVVRVRPKPASVRRQAWRFPDFASGQTALRVVAQSGFRPTTMRLSDEMETGVNLATTAKIGDGDSPGGALSVTTFEGPEDETAAFAELTATAFRAAGGTELGPALADSWDAGRYSAPYLRDALLEAGAGCETLETAAIWSKVDEVKAAVTGALLEALAASGSKALVMCHISHVYPTSASLYFTVVYAMGADPIAQWAEVKRAASQAIVDSGATISHHHGVGADHRAWLADEDGEAGVAMLRAVKSALDPNGILNPGKLIP